MAFGTGLRSVTETIDETPQGKFQESLMAAWAQFDNDLRAERTVVGMKEANRRGRFTWVAPLGYSNSGRRTGPSLIVDPERGPLIRRAFELAATGDYNKSEILRILTATGLRARSGRPLSVQTLNGLLRRPVYCGRLQARKWKEENLGDWEPLIEEEIFARVQRLHFGKGPARRYKDNPAFPLRRFVRCAGCRRPLTGSASRGRSRAYSYYHCTKCHGVRTPKEALELAFVKLLERLEVPSIYLPLFREIVADVWRSQRAEIATVRDSIHQRRLELDQKLNVLDQAFIFRREIDSTTYERQRDVLREDLALLDLAMPETDLSNRDFEEAIAFAMRVVGNVSRLWVDAEPEDKARLQSAVIPSGIDWDGATFGTTVTAPIFNVLGVDSPLGDGVVSHPIPSWNQIRSFIEQVANLRPTAKASASLPGR